MYRLLFAALMAVMVSAQADEDSNSKLFDIHLRLAAKGSAEAQFKLGEMYEEGRGTERDLVKAREWYQQAVSQGHDEAKKRLSTLGSRQSADDMARLEREAQQRAEEERRAAVQAQKRAEEERQAAAERRRIEDERERQAQQRAEEERRAAVQAQKRAEEERARQAALLKRQEEDKARAAAAAQTPAPAISESAKPSASSEAEKSFESDPCKGAASRFLSTCH